MGSNGCVTSQDGPYFGLVAPSTPCSGQGLCVNSTAYSAHFSALCICDALYSGESDMFDLRVAKMPNGTWLSLDCPNPRIGVWTMFSTQLIFLAMRLLLIMIALMRQCKFKGRLSWKETWRYMPYRVLLLETFIAGPILLGLPIQKLLPDGLVIGTDPGPTLCLVIGTFAGTWAYNDFELSQFLALVKASSMDYETHKRLIKRQRLLIWMTRLSYWCFAVVPSLVALGLDKSRGPIANGEFIALILRNIGIVLWMSSQSLADVFMQKEIRIIVNALMQMQVGGSLGTTQVLAYLNEHAAKTKSTSIVACLIWLFFSLPYFWPFQGYAMTIVTCVTVLRTANEGLVLMQSAHIQMKTEKQSAQKSSGASRLNPSPSVNADKTPNGSDLGQSRKDDNGNTDPHDSVFLNHRNKAPSDLSLAITPEIQARRVFDEEEPHQEGNDDEEIPMS